MVLCCVFKIQHCLKNVQRLILMRDRHHQLQATQTFLVRVCIFIQIFSVRVFNCSKYTIEFFENLFPYLRPIFALFVHIFQINLFLFICIFMFEFVIISSCVQIISVSFVFLCFIISFISFLFFVEKKLKSRQKIYVNSIF